MNQPAADKSCASASSTFPWGSFKTPLDPTAKQTKFLFVFPSVLEKDYFNLPKVGWNGTWHYLGYSLLSAILKAHRFPHALLDLRDLTGWEQFETAISATDAQAILLTSATSLFPRAKQIARKIKTERPELPLILGGVHASIFPEDALSCDDFDCVIEGEGEAALLDIAYGLERGEKLPRHIIGQSPDLDALPHPDRSLFPVPEDPGFYFIERPHVSVLTSRGCPFKCTFCQPASNRVFRGNIRQRSVEDVILELTALRQQGYNSIRFLDDLFFVNAKWIRRFIAAYRNAELSFQLICQARADIIVKNRQLMAELKQIGLQVIHIGFESASDKVLQILNKKTTAAHNDQALAICRELGIEVFVNYIFGVPGETEADLAATIQMLNRHKIKYRAGNVLFPTYGTSIHDQFAARDLLTPNALYGYSNLDCVEALNSTAETLDTGFFKNVDYNQVRRYLTQSYAPDYPDNRDLAEQLLQYSRSGGRLLAIFDDELPGEFPHLLSALSAMADSRTIDSLTPTHVELDPQSATLFAQQHLYHRYRRNANEGLVHSVETMSLPQYDAVLLPVRAELFHMSWSATYAVLARLAAAVPATNYLFIDHKGYITEAPQKALQSIVLPKPADEQQRKVNVVRIDHRRNQKNSAPDRAPLAQALEQDQEQLSTEQMAQLKIAFFGAGGYLQKSIGRYAELFREDQLVGVFDNDTGKRGQQIIGLDILSFADFDSNRPDLVIITSSYANEIYNQLVTYAATHHVDLMVTVA